MQYKKNIEQSSNAKLLTVESGNMDSCLLSLAQSHLKEFKFQYLIGANILKNGTIIAWFNNQAFHTAALTLNTLHNAIVKGLIGEEHSISVANAPFQFLPRNDSMSDVPDLDAFGYTFCIIIGVVFTILSSSYIQFYIRVWPNESNRFKIRELFDARTHLDNSLFVSHQTGKGEQCEIHAICQWCLLYGVLGCIDSMGLVHNVDHHFHNHCDAGDWTARSLAHSRRIGNRIPHFIHVQFCNDSTYLPAIVGLFEANNWNECPQHR